VHEVKTRKAQKARNLTTGEPVMVPSRKTVTFRAGRCMENKVNGLVGPVDFMGNGTKTVILG